MLAYAAMQDGLESVCLIIDQRTVLLLFLHFHHQLRHPILTSMHLQERSNSKYPKSRLTIRLK